MINNLFKLVLGKIVAYNVLKIETKIMKLIILDAE